MQIVDRSISELSAYEGNPRVISDEAVDQVAQSIRDFGFKVPVIVDTEGVIVAGHTRVRAAEQLGMETVPCIVADDLTPEQVRAFRLMDNKAAEGSRWDFDLLPIELSAIADAGTPIESTGFKPIDLETLAGRDDADDLPPDAVGREYDESVADDIETITCPCCGEEFPAP